MPSAAELLRRHVGQALRASEWAVEGLTDDEYLWEPVPGCWTIRRRDDAWTIDSGDDPRVTTIAWRLVHMSTVSAVYHDHTFGEATMAWDAAPVPGHATSAVAWLRAANTRFADGTAGLRDEDLDDVRRTFWGQPLPVWRLVASVAVDLVHHAAEVGTLRDLKRGRPRTDPYPEHDGAQQ